MAKKPKTADEYIEGILGVNRVMLGRAITLIESRRVEHQELAQKVIEGCLPHTGNSMRIGVTGTPGVGKSTFIDSFGNYLIEEHGKKLAVLAIDPTSRVTHGSILGDKTRMEKLTLHENAFIRPSPAGDSLGGVARKTREAMLLCEAAGFDTIMIETVGVGQSETAVHGMVDFFLLLLLPGAGDELQGIKRGIVEMADLIAINKADGDRVKLAKSARREYGRALHLFPPKENKWEPRVVTCSSTEESGLEEIWSSIEKFRQLTSESGWMSDNRRRQLKKWFETLLMEEIKHYFFRKENFVEKLEAIQQMVLKGSASPVQAIRQLMKDFSNVN